MAYNKIKFSVCVYSIIFPGNCSISTVEGGICLEMCAGDSAVTKYGYSLEELYRVAVEGLQSFDKRVCGSAGKCDAVDDKGAAQGYCQECHATDNSYVLDTRQNELVCRHCGFVDPEPIQCEWDGSSQHLILGGRRMRRKTVAYNHTYYFSEKMRCANGEGMCRCRGFVFPCCS